MTSWDFSVDHFFPSLYGPRVYSASKRNEYQEIPEALRAAEA
jgi:hypothetical protein